MKKLIFALVMAIAILSLASCGNSSGNTPENKDVITVENGYLVVNGVKTEYKVKTEDVITVKNGYLIVNGVITGYKVKTEDVITVKNGFLVVNGVKTEYFVGECEHVWETVTTPPTCTGGGYDTMTCELCGANMKKNETAPTRHNYGSNYVVDDYYHWFKCIGCDKVKDKELHDLGDDGFCTVCQISITATPGVIYDKSADGRYAEVIGYDGSAAKVKIAAEYEGLPVKNIYDRAFYNCDSLTSVIIPDSVTSIGDGAFLYCYSLTSVVIGDSVTYIGDEAFEGCSSLTSVVIPDSVTSIGYNAFLYCNSLEFNEYGNCKYFGSDSNPYFALIEVSKKNMSSYEIHKDTRIIAEGVFQGCSRLASIVIPDSVTSIGDGAFDGCDALTNVYYTGTEEEWAKISISNTNSELTGANIHYNYVPVE